MKPISFDFERLSSNEAFLSVSMLYSESWDKYITDPQNTRHPEIHGTRQALKTYEMNENKPSGHPT